MTYISVNAALNNQSVTDSPHFTSSLELKTQIEALDSAFHLSVWICLSARRNMQKCSNVWGEQRKELRCQKVKLASGDSLNKLPWSCELRALRAVLCRNNRLIKPRSWTWCSVQLFDSWLGCGKMEKQILFYKIKLRVLKQWTAYQWVISPLTENTHKNLCDIFFSAL